MGIEGFAEIGPRAAARVDRDRDRGRRAAGAVQVLPRRAPDARAAARCCATAATARCSPTAAWSADVSSQGRPSRRRLHFTGRVRLAARGAERRASAEPPPADRDRRRPRRRLPGLLPRPRLPGARPRLPARRDCSSVVWPAACRPTTSPRSSRPRSTPRLIELCFQTAGIARARRRPVAWRLPTHVDRVLALRRRRPGRDRSRSCARAASSATPARRWTQTWSTSSGRLLLRLEGYSTTALPGAVEPAALEPITARAGQPAVG